MFHLVCVVKKDICDSCCYSDVFRLFHTYRLCVWRSLVFVLSAGLAEPCGELCPVCLIQRVQ
jgi:hypothetical protein